MAGGLGTRLRPAVPHMPKVLAPVGGRPFLAYVLEFAFSRGVRRVVLATGHGHAAIEACLGTRFAGLSIAYSVEDRPLGTGGAIRQALAYVGEDHVLVLNGDTFFRVELGALMADHQRYAPAVTVAIKRVQSAGRFGRVLTQRGRLVGFVEKGSDDPGWINGGVYALRADVLLDPGLPAAFSFEQHLLEREFRRLSIRTFPCRGFFLDIGTPADYDRAEALKAKLAP